MTPLSCLIKATSPLANAHGRAGAAETRTTRTCRAHGLTRDLPGDQFAPSGPCNTLHLLSTLALGQVLAIDYSLSALQYRLFA
jgi:hypothetical protein